MNSLGVEKNYIILAEDDEDDCYFFKKAFFELPFTLDLYIVPNGARLIEYLENPNIVLPQLILLDLNMPLLDGFECLTVMKGNEMLKRIPVIIYSTSENPDDIDRTFNLGAHFYLRKSSSFPQLKNIIQKVLVMNWVNTLTQPSKEKFVTFLTA